MADSPQQKRRKVEQCEAPDLVENFLKWCGEVGLVLNPKVTVGKQGSCHRFGMSAVEDLEEGESVFQIPRDALLEPNTSAISGTILKFVAGLPESDSRNQWLPLLLTLLYEYTNPESKWWPYLDLVPSESVLNQPIFWTEKERESLTCIELKNGVDDDERSIENGFREFIVPFMEEHKQYFDPEVHTLSLYKRLSGFVMAYSFTDNDSASAKPAMVPMADILNHVSENNAHLEFGEDFLSMVTTQRVYKGDEVYNTYGDLDNCTLLRSYGFIEDCPNPYDEVEIPFEVFKDVLNLTEDDWQCKLSRFREQFDPDDHVEHGIGFSITGCLFASQETLNAFFQIIHDRMSSNCIKETDEEKNNEKIHNEETGNEKKGIKDDNKHGTNEDKGRNISKPKKLTSLSKDNPGLGKDGETEDTGGSEDDEVWESDQEEDSWDSTGDISGTDGSESDSDDSSCDDESGLISHDELQRLPVEWKKTLTRAADICFAKITDFAKKLSIKLEQSGQTIKRTSMVEKILHGRLTILQKVLESLQT